MRSPITNWRIPSVALVLLAIAGYCLANDRLPTMLAAWSVGAAGWWFTERTGGRPLPRWCILAMVLLVIAWTAYRINTQRMDVTMFCEFLTLILLVKLWDRKRTKDIAQLISMSIFLLIGAILDNNNMAVGLVVLLSMPLSAWAAMALQLGAGGERAGQAQSWARDTATRLRALAQRPSAPPAALPIGQGAARRLVPVIALATALSFVVALAIFLMMPRGLAAGKFGSVGQISQAMRTGFTADVELGRAGLISESQRTVLEVTFTDGDNRPLGGEGQIFYLRGAVLTEYADGRWSAPGRGRAEEDAARDPTRDRIIVQEVRLRESFSNRRIPYFVVWRPQLAPTGRESQNLGRPEPGRVWYIDSSHAGHLEYRAISAEQQVPEIVTERATAPPFESSVVREFAARILRSAGVDPDPATRPAADDNSVARILTGYLRGKFEYTTEINRPAAGQDPIEWFLTSERRGHCEYFASALAALCRSVGINSRVIAGYVATEYDTERGVYTVRESNAHAWTEVEVARGVWTTFDATPPVAFMAIHEPQQTWSVRLARLMDALNDTWTNSVVLFDAQQQKSIYELPRLRLNWIESLSRDAADEYLESRGKAVIKYILVTGAMLLGLAVACMSAARALSALAKYIARRKAGHGTGSAARVDPQMLALLQNAGFYAEALHVLSGAGLSKPGSVPPLAHANAVRPAHPAAGELLESISNIYYHVRFARSPLTAEQARRASELVARLRAAVARSPDSPN